MAGGLWSPVGLLMESGHLQLARVESPEASGLGMGNVQTADPGLRAARVLVGGVQAS